MGPDFLDRQCLWYMYCCNLICFLFLIQNSFSSRISGRIPDIKKGRISGRTDIRCNPRFMSMEKKKINPDYFCRRTLSYCVATASTSSSRFSSCDCRNINSQYIRSGPDILQKTGYLASGSDQLY